MKTEFESITPGYIKMKISGMIDEKAIFPKFEGQAISALDIDLKGVDGINSMGILYWIRWWKELLGRNQGMAFQLERARMNIVTSTSAVVGFLPDHARILSFYLNYYNEIDGISLEELQQHGLNFDDKKLRIPKLITRTHNGQEMTFELDCIPARDLRGLNVEIELV